MLTRRAAIALPLTLLAKPSANVLLLTPAEFAKLPKSSSLFEHPKRGQRFSITAQRPENVKVDLHDYYSEAPYFWPDPANPSGPYLRHDGKTYPKRFHGHAEAMGSMAHAVLWNALLGERKEAESLMAAWFLDPSTRMNPHFEHAQAIPNKNMGRGTGLIEARSLLHAAQGIAILDQSGPWQGRAEVMAWFGKFTDWMTGSKMGREERDSGNNHATWWTAQVAAYSLLTGDTATQQFVIKHFHDVLLRQIAADGSCPKEMARTKSFSYGLFNLEAFSILARAAAPNADLWMEPKLRKAFEFLYPYVSDPGAWKGQQITRASSDRCYPYGLAGLGFNDARFSALYRKFDKPAGPLEAVFHLVL